MEKEKLLKYNLQFFAEDGDQGTDEEGEAAATKTFTQADVDNLIKKRLERERKNMPTKEELETFRGWKASQSKETDQEEDDEGKEDQDETDTQDTDQEQTGTKKGKEADRVKQLEQQLKQMELDHALDYAIKGSGAKSAKILKSVLDMDKIHYVNGNLSGFDEQLETVKSEYSYLFGDDNKSGTWGQRQKGTGNSKYDPVEQAFLNKNPGLKLY